MLQVSSTKKLAAFIQIHLLLWFRLYAFTKHNPKSVIRPKQKDYYDVIASFKSNDRFGFKRASQEARRTIAMCVTLFFNLECLVASLDNVDSACCTCE